MLENMHREERQRLANMQLKQQAFERQMSSRIKAEHNEDIESQIIVKEIKQREIVSNRDTSQEMRQFREEYPYDVRMKQEKRGIIQRKIVSERNNSQEMRISRAEYPYENNIPSPAHSYEGSEADSSRRRELDLKEKYRKQLEADLLRKEEEIRAKINAATAMDSAEKAKTKDVRGSGDCENSM